MSNPFPDISEFPPTWPGCHRGCALSQFINSGFPIVMRDKEQEYSRSQFETQHDITLLSR